MREITMAGNLDNAQDEAEEFVGRVERKAAHASKSVSDAAVNLRHRAGEVVGDIDLAAAGGAIKRHTRAHPFRSLLIASVIGMVLGRILAGRRD
jgi:ElaB/YqjD/DUF883 family membrane-anchored ribosome-binding protein